MVLMLKISMLAVKMVYWKLLFLSWEKKVKKKKKIEV